MQAPDGRTVRIGDLEVRFLVDETESAGKVVMFELAVPPRARVPAPHYHRDVDEVVYGLEGTLTTTVAGQKRAVTVGESVFIQRGSVFTMRTCTRVAHAPSASWLLGRLGGATSRRSPGR